MKRNIILMLGLCLMVVFVGCSSSKTENSTNTSSTQKEEASADVEESTDENETVDDTSEANGESEAADLTAFANSIAEEYTSATDFNATGDYSEAEGVIITIEIDGVGEWQDHQLAELKDSISSSYEESISTMDRAGAEAVVLTYKVVDEQGTEYYVFRDGKEIEG